MKSQWPGVGWLRCGSVGLLALKEENSLKSETDARLVDVSVCRETHVKT